MGRALHFTQKKDADRNEYWKGRDSLVGEAIKLEEGTSLLVPLDRETPSRFSA